MWCSCHGSKPGNGLPDVLPNPAMLPSGSKRTDIKVCFWDDEKISSLSFVCLFVFCFQVFLFLVWVLVCLFGFFCSLFGGFLGVRVVHFRFFVCFGGFVVWLVWGFFCLIYLFGVFLWAWGFISVINTKLYLFFPQGTPHSALTGYAASVYCYTDQLVFDNSSCSDYG